MMTAVTAMMNKKIQNVNIHVRSKQKHILTVRIVMTKECLGEKQTKTYFDSANSDEKK